MMVWADLMVTQASDAEGKNGGADRTDTPGRWAEIVVLVGLAGVLILASVSSGDYWLLLMIASPVVGVVAGIVCHEFGHMLCAVLLSVPVRLMSIGVGPLLWRGRLGETSLELRALPLFGCVGCYPQPIVRKISTLVFILGGVMGNVVLVGLVAAVDRPIIVSDRWQNYLGLFVLVQYLIIVQNLLPYWIKFDGVRIGSDGLQLLQLAVGPWRGPTEAGLRYAAALDCYGGAKRSPPRRANVRVMYQVLRPERWTDAEARRDFQDGLQRELGRSLSRQETMLALDALVTLGLLHPDQSLRAHLDAWSEQALRLGPDIATLRGTRGAVLVELGRYEEGKALLAPLAGSRCGGAFDEFMTSVFLARAERGLGNVAAARALAAAASEHIEDLSAHPAMAFMLSQLDAELAAPPEQPGSAA